MKKNLYCNKCCEYPDTITEVYREPHIEYREWNEEMDCYELQDTNLDLDNSYVSKCGICETELQEIEFEDLTENERAKMVVKKL